ncbi:lysophospholipid acyltransferase family protein [Thiosocius teredinicola]|uniref:lysophospholipid acyltransferase family protein n=1 Tax=Thiosocius teredinicola TaxID=1973002 RepID=UPI0009911072
MAHPLRFLFFALIVRPLVLIVLGLHVRRRELMPNAGPAVVVANHNSHLDTLVLMSLFPLRLLPKIRPVAAMDYFMTKPFTRWFALNIIGIIPLQRQVKAGHKDPLSDMVDALDRGEILILFPEGSRGEPERLGKFKTGVAHLAKRRPDVPIVPVYLHGLGMALPKGEAILVPFFCDVFIGRHLQWSGDRNGFMETLGVTMQELVAEGNFRQWE